MTVAGKLLPWDALPKHNQPMLIVVLRSGLPESFGFLFPLAIVATVLGLFYFFQKKREKELAAAAANVGFISSEDVPISCEMPLFSHNITVNNIYSGTVGGYEATFYDLTVNQGKSSYSQTVAGFRRAGLVLPTFEIHPTEFGDRIAAHFPSRLPRIEFLNSEFSKRYTVHSITPVECTRFFAADVQAYFMNLPEHSFTLEAADDSVIVYKRQQKIAPTKIESFLQEAGSVAAGLLGILHPTSIF